MKKEPSTRASERVIGFDAREMWLDEAERWTSARRAKFLLRDVPKPLSVDPLVWPSVFGDGMPDLESARATALISSLPSWRGANNALWNDLSWMQKHLMRAEIGAYWVIAVTWASEAGFESGPIGPHAEPTQPVERNESWEPIGYDVADGGLISGLSNCAYEEDEAKTLQKAWAPQLNEHHLFPDVKDALAFRSLSEKRVPEHAPFFVFGLWLVGKR